MPHSRRTQLAAMMLLLGCPSVVFASLPALHSGLKQHTSFQSPYTILKAGEENSLQDKRSRVINTLMAQLGKPYRWGGDSPHTGFDCSGLVYYTWHKALNVHLPRTASDMYNHLKAGVVSRHQLQPGDIVFFAITGNGIDHVGVYLGNGHFIEAPHKGENVKIASLESQGYRQSYRGARRIPTGNTDMS